MNISFTPSTLTITSLRLTVADIEDDPEGEVAEDGAIVDDGSDEEDVMFMGGGAAGRGFSASSINNSNVGGMHSVGGKGGSSEASSAGRFPLPNPNVDSTAWWAEVLAGTQSPKTNLVCTQKHWSARNRPGAVAWDRPRWARCMPDTVI